MHYPILIVKLTNTQIASSEERGVILFVTGVWWKPSGWFTKTYRAVQKSKKQDFLDGGDETDAAYVDKPDSEDTQSSSKTVLELIPGSFGMGEGLERLAPHSDFSAMYSGSDDSDESDED